MTSQRKNRTIYIDKEAASALELVADGLLLPVSGLMGAEESKRILETGMIEGKSFPFPFILAPSGRKNELLIPKLKVGEEITIICEREEFATLIVEETFKIDPKERLRQIYGTDDIEHPGVKSTLKRLGVWAISGPYTIINKQKNKNLITIEEAKKRIDAKHTTSLVMGANPLHRAHERLIRQTLDGTDLLVIFLLKPYNNANLSYEIRKEALEYFVDNYLTKSRVVIIPLENSYIFAGYNEIMIDAIVASNYGCDTLKIGRNHAGLGMFYDSNSNKSIVDKVIGIDIEIKISSP